MLSSARGTDLIVMALTTVALLLMVGVLGANPAHAETFTVNSTANPGSGVCDATECTLREAIDAANSNAQSDTIGFAPALRGEIELSNTPGAGRFIIFNDSSAEDLTINGPGANALAIDGNNQVQVFAIVNGANATINGLAIKDGNSSVYDGGSIANNATLTVSNSTIISSATDSNGGAIYNHSGSTLTVRNSTISGNSTGGLGGGIYNYGGTVSVSNSTVSGNSANSGSGGGISNYGGTVSVSNSTVSGNSAKFLGGGLSTESFSGTFSVNSTIVAGNSVTDTTSTNPEIYGVFSSQGYNLIGAPGTSSGWTSSDKLNQSPLLGPLQNNGGTTKTHALLPGSAAINAIPASANGCGTTVATDQRGVKRPQGGKCEIGSFEDNSPRVTRVVPQEGATGIAPGANVSAFFSEAMRAASINTNTVKLFKAGTTSALGAVVSYDASTKKAVLNPNANLRVGTRYKAVVTTGARDLAGNQLDQDQNPSNGKQPKVWLFTVRN